MDGIRASIRHVQFAAAKYRASAIAAPKISRGTCRGNIACETRRFVPIFFLRLPRQSLGPDYFCSGKVSAQIIFAAAKCPDPDYFAAAKYNTAAVRLNV